MSLYTVYTVILSIIVYAEISRGQEDPAEMEILGSQSVHSYPLASPVRQDSFRVSALER